MMFAPEWEDTADVIVIGTGVAGLAAALAAHRAGRKVVVLSKADQRHGVTATHYAQGGIAVVLPDNPTDSVDDHVADTLAAGAGMCDPDAVYSIVADGYRAVTELVGDGARFDESAPGRLGADPRRRPLAATHRARRRRRHRRRGAAGARRRGRPAGHPHRPRGHPSAARRHLR